MLNIKLSLTNETRQSLEEMLQPARVLGDIRLMKRVISILMVSDGQSYSYITSILQVSGESIRLWVLNFLLYGCDALRSKKSPGRKSKLTKTQKKQLSDLISAGPSEAGYPGACWRSPMIQDLIFKKFGVFYSVFYIAQLLKNMGFSYQKARFVSDHLDKAKREAWIKHTWPEIYELAKRKDAYTLFGDEASFPQWGTLSYTWAKKGVQPTVKTSGNRKAYKVFGAIDYFTGRFFFKTHEGRFNSESYSQFLKEILGKTNKHIIFIQDGAKYHTSKALQAFFLKHKERLSVYQLPSYSPDYNPIEKLWKKIKQKGTHMHYFPTFEYLKDKVQETLVSFENTPEKIITLFVKYNQLNQEIMAA